MKPASVQFTKEGYQQIQTNFQNLTEKRKVAIIRLQTAREMGDLSENGAYKAARFELSAIDRELRKLTYLLSIGQVTETKNRGLVDFGCRVTLVDGLKRLSFTLVSTHESDPRQDKLSIDSPIGKASLGKRVGDIVTVTAPAGQTSYTVADIE